MKNEIHGGCWIDALDTSSIQTHKNCYKFNDTDYDKDIGDFPNKRDILNYFNKAINNNDIGKRVIYNVEFTIEKMDDSEKSPYKWVFLLITTIRFNVNIFCFVQVLW